MLEIQRFHFNSGNTYFAECTSFARVFHIILPPALFKNPKVIYNDVIKTNSL